MSVINQIYSIDITLQDRSVELKNIESIELYNTDKNITTFKFFLYKNKNKEGYRVHKNEIKDFEMKLTILKPKTKNIKELTGVLDEKTSIASYSFDIPDYFIDEVGTYLCEIRIENSEQVFTANVFKYVVDKSMITELNPDIEDSPDLPVLKQLIQEVRDLKLSVGINDDIISDETTWSSQLIDSKFKQMQEEGLIFSKETNAEMQSIIEPKDGALCWVVEEGIYYTYSNGNWSECQMGGSGGGAVSGYISTTSPENIIVPFGNNLDLNIDFSSPNIGKGTLKVLINDVEAKSISISQGENTVTIEGDLFTKGNNKLTVYALDRTGVMTNDLTFTVRYGSTEITSTFDSDLSYDYGSVIRYYFTPTAIDTSSKLTFYMKIDDVTQNGISCVSDTRSYYTFPTNLYVGSHYCEAWVEDDTGKKSNILTFNLIILDETSLVVSSNTKEVTIEEGEQLSLDYKVYMKNNSSFITKTYIDENLVNTGTCGLATSYYKTSSLVQGIHTIKVEVFDITETTSDYITWTITVTESTYEMKQPITTGAVFLASAKNRTNSDENKEVWIGKDQDNNEITANLYNFAFNSKSGWMDNQLFITGNSYVEVPIAPLKDNAKYGFTLDIEFLTKPIGVEDAEVLTLWNNEDNCGIKITTEKCIIQSKKENKCELYFSENEIVSAMFVIDRDEKTAKIYLNGVMCKAFVLSDYSSEGVSYLEDFTVNSNIFLGGKDKNGYSAIRNLRVYEIALGSNEILNNFISNEIDKKTQQQLVKFQEGNDLPTLTIYGDFSGLGKDDKKPCDIVYISPDVTKYGESFTLDGKTSLLQYQGTSSMQYPIKNYRLNLRDENGAKWKYAFPDSKPECRFTLKCDFMSSGHWQNTGLTKWINDNLYSYDSKNEKSMNPAKWWALQNGGDINDYRECIYGFPCRLILVNDGTTPLNEGQEEPTPGNTKDMGIFNFNLDKDCENSLGFTIDDFPNAMSFEVTANSDTSAGAFVSYANWNGDKSTVSELDYLLQSFEVRYNKYDNDTFGILDVNGDTNLGLKRIIDFVDNSTDEEFVNNFEDYFLKDYVLRYYILVIVLGMVDNLGKNCMWDSYDGKIFMPRFYDCDTICSYDNSGAIKFDVDIEMEQGYWNTSSSRLWTRVRDLFHDELVEKYNNMRQNGMSYESFMSYFYDEQIAKIPQKYYNMDYDVKYAPYANEYMGKAHGDGYEHLKRWLKNRLIFTDTLFDYAPAYTNDMLTIRANTTELMSLTIETYTPVYQHLSWYNGNMEKEKIAKGTSFTFTGEAQAGTDQEVLIYGGSNIKRITGISSMNPDSMLIGSATRLVELSVTDCPILTDINSSKANLEAHTYLSKLDLSNCPQLGGTLRVNKSPLLKEINIQGTGITNLQLPSSIRNLETLKLPNTITDLTLNDASLLKSLHFEDKNNLTSVSMTNCNALTDVANFDLTQVSTVTLNNSYDTEELYMSKTTDLSLNNMKNLKRLVYVPNSEVEEFNLSNLMSASEYKITTFNCPNLTDFITTAQQRLSYRKTSDGNIYPNQVFMASLLDLSSTQFTNIKFLCTTDLYKLMLPTTVKNFYCDSAFDLDTSVVTDGEYDVVHGDLIEPYTTNYESNVYYGGEEISETIPSNSERKKWYRAIPKLGSGGGGYDEYGLCITNDAWCKSYWVTDFIPIFKNSSCSISSSNSSDYVHIAFCDEDKKIIERYTDNTNSKTIIAPNDAKYVVFGSVNRYHATQISYVSPIPPNIVSTSANGSLIYNVWSQLGTQPSSTSPYIWDLTGLKFNNFHTYGMNNCVKPNDDSLVKIGNDNLLKIGKYTWTGTVGNIVTISSHPNFISISPIEIKNNDIVSITSVLSENNNSTTWNWNYYICDESYKVLETNNNFQTNTGSVVISNESAKYLIVYIRGLSSPLEDLQIIVNGVTYKTEEVLTVNELLNSKINLNNYSLIINNPTSITMPQRTTGYSVRLQNADITPNNYNTMLYPLFIDTTLPIVGKMDYSKYKGNNLSWAFAYTTDAVSRTPMGSRDMGNIKYDYNKLYNTDYVDIVDVWVYSDTDCSSLSTNENITKAYIELTQDNYQSRIDEVLQWYPNCTEIHIFDNNDVTSLENFIGSGYDVKNYNNTYAGKQVKKVYFMENYFSKLESLLFAFRDTKIEEVYNIPNAVKNMNGFASYGTPLKYISNFPSALTNLQQAFIYDSALVELPSIPNTVKILDQAFQGCTKFNQQLDLSNLNLNDGGIKNLFNGCTSLTYTPILPSNYTGTLQGAFQNTKITTAPVLPDGVTSLENTFNGCAELTTVGNIPSSCNTFRLTFANCSKLISVPQEGWNGNMYQTFVSCTSLNQKFIINSATSLSWTFAGTGLTITPTLPSNMNGSMDRCFRYCNLTTPPITPNGVTSLSYCYQNNYLLTSAPNIPSSCTDISNYISGCSKITEVAIPVDVVTNYSNALSSCSEITDIDWTGKRTTDFSLTLLKCPSYTQEDLKELVNENLEDLYKDKIKINYGSKITINNTETTL